MESWLVVGISGVTCGGKTTLANSLYKYFNENRNKEIKTGIELGRIEILNQDNYFLPEDDPRHKYIDRLNSQNWEIISSLDMDKMCNDIMVILGNKFTLYSTKSSSNTYQDNLFSNHFSSRQSNSLKLRKYGTDQDLINDESYNEHCNFNKHLKHDTTLNILILEGFLIFNHTFTLDICNVKFHLHLPYEKCHSRRAVRTYNPPDVIGELEIDFSFPPRMSSFTSNSRLF